MIDILIGLFLSGLLFSFGPCLYSCGPALVCYIVGNKNNVRESLLSYIVFSSGRIFVYLVLSFLVFLIGGFYVRNFLGSAGYFFQVSGIFIVLLGLMIIFRRNIKFKPLVWLENKLLVNDKKSIFIIGLTYGIIPCLPFWAVISYIGLFSKNWAQSIIYAFAFGLGTFLSPVLLLSLSAGLIPQFFQKYKAPLNILRILSGLILVYLGAKLTKSHV